MLVAAVKHWQDDWKATAAKRSAKSLEQQLAEEVALRLSAEAELEKTRAELVNSRQEVQQGKGLEEKHEQQLQAKLEEEKEKRVAHLQQMGVRRLKQMGLARGWTAWLDEFREYQRKKRLMLNAGARLSRPKMVAAFVHWQSVRLRAYRKNEAKSRQQILDETLARHKAEQVELQQVIQSLRQQLEESGNAAEAMREHENEMQRKMNDRFLLLVVMRQRTLVSKGLLREEINGF